MLNFTSLCPYPEEVLICPQNVSSAAKKKPAALRSVIHIFEQSELGSQISKKSGYSSTEHRSKSRYVPVA
jgi:hypothetical protein